MFNALKKKAATPAETKPADVAAKTPAEPSRGLLFNPFKKKSSEITADDSSKGKNSSNEQTSDDATSRPKTQHAPIMKATKSIDNQPNIAPKNQALGQKIQSEKGSNDSVNSATRRATISKPQKSRTDEIYSKYLADCISTDNDFNQSSIPKIEIGEANLDPNDGLLRRHSSKQSSGQRDTELLNNSQGNLIRKATIRSKPSSNVNALEAINKTSSSLETKNSNNQTPEGSQNITTKVAQSYEPVKLKSKASKLEPEINQTDSAKVTPIPSRRKTISSSSKAEKDVQHKYKLEPEINQTDSAKVTPILSRRQTISSSSKTGNDAHHKNKLEPEINQINPADSTPISRRKTISKAGNDVQHKNKLEPEINQTDSAKVTPIPSRRKSIISSSQAENDVQHKYKLEPEINQTDSVRTPIPSRRKSIISSSIAETNFENLDSKHLKSEVDKYLMDREDNPKLALLRRKTITKQNSNQPEKERNAPMLDIDKNKRSGLESEPTSRKNQEYHSTLDISGCMARFRKVARSIGIFSVWFKYLSSHLKHPVQRGWEYDPKSYLLNNPYALKKKTILLGTDLSVLNEFKRISPYKGKLDENIRTLFRKPAKDRTPNDLNILLDYVSRMNGFEKYSETSQRIFLQYGRYEKWNSGTTIMRQGAAAEGFFILLEGELIISKIFDTDGYAAAISEAKEDQTAIDAQFIKKLGKFVSGDSFGEAVFGSQAIQLRTATITTLKPSEFLIVNAKESGAVGKISSDKSIQSRIDLIIQNPLLSYLKIDKKVLSYYCKLKSFKMDQHVIKEAECHDSVYFIKSGLCQIQKTIKTWKTPTGKLIITELDGAVLKNESIFPDDKIVFDQLEFVKSDTVALGELGPGEWFGEGQFSKIEDPREALFGPSCISVKVMNRSDIMMVPKADIDRYAMKPVWEAFRAKTKEMPKDKLYELYKKTSDWIDFKKDMNVLNN